MTLFKDFLLIKLSNKFNSYSISFENVSVGFASRKNITVSGDLSSFRGNNRHPKLKIKSNIVLPGNGFSILASFFHFLIFSFFKFLFLVLIVLDLQLTSLEMTDSLEKITENKM